MSKQPILCVMCHGTGCVNKKTILNGNFDNKVELDKTKCPSCNGDGVKWVVKK